MIRENDKNCCLACALIDKLNSSDSDTVFKVFFTLVFEFLWLSQGQPAELALAFETPSEFQVFRQEIS